MRAQAAATAGLTLAPSWPGFVGLFSVWAFNLSMLMPTLLVSPHNHCLDSLEHQRRAQRQPCGQAFAVDISPPEKVGQAQAAHRQAADFVFFTAPVGLGLLADLSASGANFSLPIWATAGGMLSSLWLFRRRVQ